MSQYIELHSRSAFSFLEGSSLPESLIARCAELKMPAMALLDRDGVYGAPRFHMAAKRAGIKAHIGADFRCNFARRFSLYGSLFIDEFLISEIRKTLEQLRDTLPVDNQPSEKGLFDKVKNYFM